MSGIRPGCLLLGASAVLLGIVLLLDHDSAWWQRLLAAGSIAGGATMLLARTARIAAAVLGAVYAIFTLACVPGMIRAPADPGSYVNFFEQLSIVCGAIAVYTATGPDAGHVALDRAARLMLGICAASFGWAQLVYLQYTASLVPAWIPPSQLFWTILTTVAFGLAAIAMLVNRQARLAMQLMAAMMALFGILVWVPKIAVHPAALSNWNEIATNYLMTAASWLVATRMRAATSA